MNTLSFHTADDGPPVLVLDQSDVDGDALLTLRAGDIALLALAATESGARAGAAAMSASRRTRRTVERDAQGRIVSILEEPVLPEAVHHG